MSNTSTNTAFRTTSLKGAFLIINGISAIIAIATVVSCAVAQLYLNGWHFGSCLVGIVVGALLLILCLLAYCGAKRESLCLLWTCVGVILIVLLVQLGLIVFEYAYDTNQITTDLIEQLWLNKVQNPVGMASVERNYNCCGRNGAQDYAASNMSIPDSCYRNGIPSQHPFYFGCVSQMKTISNIILRHIHETVIWLTVFEVLNLYFGVKLINNLKNRKKNGSKVFVIKNNFNDKIRVLLVPEFGKDVKHMRF